jgi:hypothetical protein
MKKDAFYFPHYSNARNDRKLKRVIKDLGIEGYAIYFMILEVLRDQPNFKYPIKDIDLLADEFGTTDAKLKVVISNYELFIIDANSDFFSIKQIQYLQPYIEKSQRARDAANKRWTDANAYANALQMECSSNATKVKESKVKEIKVNNIEERKLKFASTLEPFLNTYGKEMIKEFYDYWTEPNKSNTKFKAEGEKTWGIERRLSTWAKNQIKFGGPTQSTTPQAAAPRRPFTG